MDTGRKDPLFGIRTPVVFSHRGGAREAPESTEEAFRHASITVGVDVLELDIHVTKDREIVVWHGPELDIVHDGKELLKGKDIRDTAFHDELKDKAWVVHPDALHDLDPSPERRLLTLRDFIELVNRMEGELHGSGTARTLHVNIELKAGRRVEKEWTEVWDRLFGVLDREADKRRIVLASAKHRILEVLRDEMNRPGRKTYVTNLSTDEQLSFRKLMPGGTASFFFRWLVPIFVKPKHPSKKPYAFETYFKLAGTELARKVREDQSSLYVFLTAISIFPSVDEKDDKELKKVITGLLEAGVDGIMTDYPSKVMDILKDAGIKSR